MSPAKVSLGQLDTRTLVVRMTSLRGEVLALRGRVVEGSIPHARLTELISHLDQNTFLITGGASQPGAADSSRGEGPEGFVRPLARSAIRPNGRTAIPT